jgi:hypothetical protein
MSIKIWTSSEKNDDKIIALLNDSVYKANPSESEIESYVFDLKLQKIPSKNSFKIPLHYISMITQQDGKKYIEVTFKGDYEHLKVNDDKTRNEVFEFLKQNIPGVTHTVVRISKFQTAKKPLIAMGVVSALFLWCLYVAIGMEAGNEYDVTGQHYHSIAGIVLAIASIGIKKVILLFGSLLLIAGFSFIKKYRNPIVKDTLLIKH